MRIVVAPDSYKGSVSALAVAQAMERGIRRVFADADVRKIPIVDGGEGTVEALVAATGGRVRASEISGPLGTRSLAQWGVLGDGKTAVIEAAAAAGLGRGPRAKSDPRKATSYAIGQLIIGALDAGLRTLLIGAGGSAASDGGAGMARALGVRFLDARGRDLPDGGAALARLARIDLSGLDRRLHEAQITVACDVDNPLCGPRGASAVCAAPASPEIVAELDAALRHFALLAQAATGRDAAERPGAGAAGGLGAGLMFFTPATLKPGVELVLGAVGFAAIVKDASFVITGEGRTDFQTAFGKAPVGVARAAKRYGVPVFCISGGLGEGADEVLAQGIDAVMSVCDRPMTLDECMASGPELIEAAAARLCRVLKAGRQGR